MTALSHSQAASDNDAGADGENRRAGGVPVLPQAQVRFGLAARLSMALLGAAVLVFVTAFYYDYRESRRHMLDTVEGTVAGLSAAIVNGLDMMRADVETVAAEVARGLTQGDSSAELQERAREAIAGSQHCQSVTVIIESPGGGPQRPVLRCHRSRRIPVACEDLDGADAVLAELRRYKLSADPAGGVGWSEPSLDPGRSEPVTRYEQPIYRESADGPVQVGAVSAELTLAHLATAIEGLRLFQSGYAIVLSRQGHYLAYPEFSVQQWSRRGTIFDLARAQQAPALKMLGERMARGETGFMPFHSPHLDNQPAHVFFTSLPGTGWSIGVVFADSELFTPLNDLAREIVLICGAGLALLLALVLLIVHRFTRPLLVLTEKSAAIAGGNLDVAIPEPRTRDEVGVLASSFAAMRRALRQQLEILAEARAAGARLDSELKIARAIQASFLPRDPAGLAGAGGLAMATWFQPAREVGGDLYNCFWLEDGRLFLSIGDVAGKSVPAALMMAVTTTLIKAVAATVPDPAEVLRRVNGELCATNEELLFVTLFAATLAPETGDLAFSNAGHNPPLILRADGTAGYMTVAPGLVLGVEPDHAYATARLRLEPGDILLLYTDGLTEAMDVAGECFGPDRLLAASRSPDGGDPFQLVRRIISAVAAHVGAAEQSDDLTLLAVARLEGVVQPVLERRVP